MLSFNVCLFGGSLSLTCVNKLEPGQAPFENAEIFSPPDTPEASAKLSSPRAYTFSLSPHIIYSRSRLLPTLLSSKVYRQLEFQAVGSWWVYKPSTGVDAGDNTASNASHLYRVPSSREDVFADDLISMKSKRTLMKFLRHIGKPQQDSEGQEDDMSMSFPEYLSSSFQVPAELHEPLLSLSLSQASPQQTSADYAVPRIQRHLASIGVFGPGFGSLLAKWGGGSELSQVGCRALAVGGGVYVLNSGIESITNPSESNSGEDVRMQVKLSNGESIQTKFVVGSHWDLPAQAQKTQPSCDKVARSITVVSSPLESLFPVTAEGGPIPAGAVVVIPGSSLDQAEDSPPVYLLIHSSDTGECPIGQSKFRIFHSTPPPMAHMMNIYLSNLIYIACTIIDENYNLIMSHIPFEICVWLILFQLVNPRVLGIVYGSVSLSGSEGYALLETAINRLLQSVSEANAKVLWSLLYTQLGRTSTIPDAVEALKSSSPSDSVICFPPSSLDHAFDDQLLDMVKGAWKTVMGEDAIDEEFMNFEDREGASDE